MPTPEMQEKWKRIETFLRAALYSLDIPVLRAEEFLSHNEFELAWEELNEAAARRTPGPAFQPCMDAAARLMDLVSS